MLTHVRLECALLRALKHALHKLFVIVQVQLTAKRIYIGFDKTHWSKSYEDKGGYPFLLFVWKFAMTSTHEVILPPVALTASAPAAAPRSSVGVDKEHLDTALEVQGHDAPELSALDRFLPLWIVLAAALGLGLGQFAQVHTFIEVTTVGNMNTLVGVGLVAMMYPPLASVRWPLVRTAFASDWRLLALSMLQNWVVGPSLMFALSAAFFHDDPGFLAGFSLVGCARCIGMVMIWIALAGGDLEAGAALLALNAALTLALYAFYATFFLDTLPTALGLATPAALATSSESEALSLHLTVADVASNVGLYLGVPFVLALGLYVVLVRMYGARWYYEEYAPRLDVLALSALLFTIAVLFASQSHRLTTTLAPVLLASVPFTLYFAVIFASTFVLSQRLCGASYAQCATLAFTATSNNYELSLGVAVATFGLDSDPAMMSVVAALVEIPTMLALVWLAQWAETHAAFAQRDDARHESGPTHFVRVSSPQRRASA